MRRSAVAVLALVAVSGFGCSHTQRPLPESREEAYRIGREDVLDISVWRDGDLSRRVPVRPDGFISVPILGEVKAEGKTTEQLAAELQKRLAPFVQEPRVTVILFEVNAARFFVAGEVTRPGAFPLRGRVSLVQAIALAGGFSAFADQDGILVIRQGKNAGRYPVRYSDLVSASEESEQSDLWLQPGDTVVVP